MTDADVCAVIVMALLKVIEWVSLPIPPPDRGMVPDQSMRWNWPPTED